MEIEVRKKERERKKKKRKMVRQNHSKAPPSTRVTHGGRLR